MLEIFKMKNISNAYKIFLELPVCTPEIYEVLIILIPILAIYSIFFLLSITHHFPSRHECFPKTVLYIY